MTRRIIAYLSEKVPAPSVKRIVVAYIAGAAFAWLLLEVLVIH